MNIDVGRPVVTVGVDGSECALRAVRWAAAEAARRGAALRLVTAFGWLTERTTVRVSVWTTARRCVVVPSLSW
jgi:nucleotide-binding universal stress UspA family protein